MYSQTEGNPLFVNEVVRLLVQEGELSPERLAERKSWSVRIPEGVREVIGRRLDRLSERCNQVLTMAAVLGREFSFAQMAKLAEDHERGAAAGGAGGGDGGAGDRGAAAAGGALPVHPCPDPGDAGGGASSARRVRLHARIAQALEALYGAQAEAHAAELAFHFGEAEPVLGAEKLVHYSLLAGEKALAGYAYEDALAHFQRGLAAKEGQPMDEQTAALLYGLGRAEAPSSCWMKLPPPDCGLRLLCTGRRCAALPGRGVGAVTESRGFELMAPVVERALQLAPPEAVETGWLLCVRGRYLGVNRQDREGPCAASAGPGHRPVRRLTNAWSCGHGRPGQSSPITMLGSGEDEPIKERYGCSGGGQPMGRDHRAGMP